MSRGEAARTALITAAEQLFAERGIETVSLRDISAAAGQRNNSAAQYHFGDRAGLVAAVYSNRMAIVNERRHARLDELDAALQTDDLRLLLAATIEPLIEVVDESNGWYARFLVRTRWDTFARTVVADLPVLSSFRRAIDLIAELLDVPDAWRTERIDQMSTLFIGTIAGWEWRGHESPSHESPQSTSRPTASELAAELITTCHAVLTAHTSVPTITTTGGSS